MKHSDSIQHLASQLAGVQAALRTVVATKTVKVEGRRTFSYTYATLAECMDVLRPLLSEYGIVVMQPTAHQPGFVVVETWLVHSATGEYVASEASVPIANDMGAQAIGSAISYLRRYALNSLIGLVVDDDDDGKNAEDQRKRSDWAARESFKRKSLEAIGASQTQEALEAWWETNQYSVADQDPDTVTSIKMAITKRHKELALINAKPAPSAQPAAAAMPAERPQPAAAAAVTTPQAPVATPVKPQPVPAQVPKQPAAKKTDSNDPFSGFFS